MNRKYLPRPSPGATGVGGSFANLVGQNQLLRSFSGGGTDKAQWTERCSGNVPQYSNQGT